MWHDQLTALCSKPWEDECWLRGYGRGYRKLFTVHLTPRRILRTTLQTRPNAAILEVVVSPSQRNFVSLYSRCNLTCTECVIKSLKREDWQRVYRLSSKMYFACLKSLLMTLHLTVWHYHNRHKQVSTANTNQKWLSLNDKNQPAQTRFPKSFFNK